MESLLSTSSGFFIVTLGQRGAVVVSWVVSWMQARVCPGCPGCPGGVSWMSWGCVLDVLGMCPGCPGAFPGGVLDVLGVTWVYELN